MTIPDDPRPIAEIHTEGHFWAVGFGATTKIEPYREGGQMGYVPWFKVYNGERIMTRVNAAHVVWVDYAPERETDTQT